MKKPEKTRLVLSFVWDIDPVLEETQLKYSGLYNAHGELIVGELSAVTGMDFNSTRGPQALVLFMLAAKLRSLKGSPPAPFNRAAAKTLYELLKKPSDIIGRSWPTAIFGYAANRDPLISQLIINGGSDKTPSPRLNQQLLPAHAICIGCDGVDVSEHVEVLALLERTLHSIWSKTNKATRDETRSRWRALRQELRTKAAPLGPPVLVVEPFEMSEETDAQLVEGLRDDVIVHLARYKGLRVVSPQYTTDKSDPMLLLETGTSFLTGIVRLVNDGSKLHLRLIESKGVVRWAQSFDLNQSALGQIVHTISSDVGATMLGIEKTTPFRVQTDRNKVDVAAYEYYLRALALANENTEGQMRIATALLRKALEIEPQFADAIGLFGHCLWKTYFSGWSSDISVMNEARVWVDRARSIDPESEVAILTLIRLMWDSGAHEEALLEGMKLWRRVPDSLTAMLALARAQNNAGLAEKSLLLVRRVLRHDPLNVAARKLEVWALCMAGQFAEAVSAGTAYLERHNLDTNTMWAVALAYMHLQQWNDAIRVAEQGLESEPGDVFLSYLLGYAWRGLSESEKSQSVWNDGIIHAERRLGGSPSNLRIQAWLASLYAGVKDRERAEKFIEIVRAQEPQNGYLLYRLACAKSELDDQSEAIALLREAVSTGFLSVQLMEREEITALSGLSVHAQYRSILRELRAKVSRLAAKN